TSHSMNESEFEELKDLIGADGRERQVIDGIKSIPKSFDLKHKIVESNSQGKIPLAKQVDPLTSAQALEKLELPLQKKIKPKMSFLDGDCWAIRSSYADRWISRYSRSDQKFNLLEFLKERHISRVIKGIDFTDLYWLSNLECKGITFEECRFEYMTMDHSIFERTVFKNCDLQKIKMTYSLFDRCHFIDSNLKNGLFLKSKFIQSVFDQCVLDRVCFESAVFDYCSFYQTAMRGMSLFLAKFSECRAKECDLTQTVLCDAKEGLLLEECTISPKKRPVMAMGCDFRYRMSFGELIENSLKDNEADVLLHSYEPHDVVSYELNREIRETLKEFTPQCQMSRAQFVLASAKPGSQVDKIIQIAKQVLAHSDGVIIPGGSDVEREFYVDEEVSFYTDHRRSMMEFALIAEAEKTNQLVAGICRGSQLLNVYFGGTLRDLDDTSYGIQQLTAVSDEGSRKANRLFSDLFKDGFCGFSCHNQAIDELAPNLQAVLKYEDIIKATESKCGRFFGIQFHPEEYYDLEHQSDLSFVFIRMLRLREFYQKVKSQILRATEEIQGELFEQLEYMIEVGKFSEKANREIYARLVRRAAQLSGKIA
ncbi:MAG: gamma-glutamyl-gamma-aminobutyrate hydrolase family protein, partial [Simkaniaceae bacterium]|nr:gamma-glutamyl-gamma-aminobutyrate hydrolase family protein [Simkaniaceae bacterium]